MANNSSSSWSRDRKTGKERLSKRNDGRFGGHAKKSCAFNGDAFLRYWQQVQSAGVAGMLFRHDALNAQLQQTGRSFDLYANSASGVLRGRLKKTQLKPKSKRPLCGAKTRAGGTCKAKVCARPDGQGMATKCRLHGGATPCKPKSPEGRANIAAANRARAKPKET